jgi:YVTN family beta-propeller protein
VPTGKTPRGVSITPDGSRIYVANYGDDTVSVFNAADLTPVALIPVGMKPLSIGHFIADVPLSGKTITVIPTGTGSGTVTSYPPGINCGSDCAEAYSDGQTITLTASADGGSVFAGWSGGGCSGINPCVITLTADVTVTATFILRPQLPIDEGTIGTQITITGSDFGIKKGKVLIGNVATKIISWADTLITCTVTKVPLPAETAYDVMIMTKGIGTITLPKAFTVKLPEPAIDPGVNDHGASGDPITINGNFFGTKKGKVYLEYLGKNKNCKVTGWNMTSITFLVPKKLVEGKYPLNITNKIGTVGVVGFTIDSPLP